MLENCELSFRGEFAVEGRRLNLEFTLRQNVTRQIELLGRCEQDPKSLRLELGSTGTIEGGLIDGRSLRVEKATVAEILERTAGAISISFAVESVYIHRAAGPYSRSVFSDNTNSIFTWVLTGAAWLDDWIKNSGPNPCFRLSSDCELMIEGREILHPIQSSRLGHAARSLYSVPVLTYKQSASGKTLEDIKAKVPQELADNLLTALSCFSRSRIDWTQRSLSIAHPDDEQHAESVFRMATPTVLINYAYPGIYPPKVPSSVIEFASTRVGEVGESLRSAIQFYVASFGLVEHQAFVALTTSLEALKQSHIERQPVSGILPEENFKELRNRVQERIKEHLTGTEFTFAIDQISEKLSELNRPAYAAVVKDMCVKLNVDLAQIYPNELTFISVRNNMIHQGLVPEADRLRTETILIRKLVEAILRKMLTPVRDKK
jgi:hypothetical protein